MSLGRVRIELRGKGTLAACRTNTSSNPSRCWPPESSPALEAFSQLSEPRPTATKQHGQERSKTVPWNLASTPSGRTPARGQYRRHGRHPARGPGRGDQTDPPDQRASPSCVAAGATQVAEDSCGQPGRALRVPRTWSSQLCRPFQVKADNGASVNLECSEAGYPGLSLSSLAVGKISWPVTGAYCLALGDKNHHFWNGRASKPCACSSRLIPVLGGGTDRCERHTAPLE